MMSEYETWCLLFIGAYLVTKNWLSPWAAVVAGAMIFCLSVIKLVG